MHQVAAAFNASLQFPFRIRRNERQANSHNNSVLPQQQRSLNVDEYVPSESEPLTNAAAKIPATAAQPEWEPDFIIVNGSPGEASDVGKTETVDCDHRDVNLISNLKWGIDHYY